MKMKGCMFFQQANMMMRNQYDDKKSAYHIMLKTCPCTVFYGGNIQGHPQKLLTVYTIALMWVTCTFLNYRAYIIKIMQL